MKDADIACGHAEAMDVLQREGRIRSGGSTIPIGEALLASGLDGGCKIHGLDRIDVDGSQLIRQFPLLLSTSQYLPPFLG